MVLFQQVLKGVTMRIQFEITEEFAKRLMPHILSIKNRHVFAHKALEEWVNRQEGNDKRRK